MRGDKADMGAEREAIHRFHDESLTALMAGDISCFAKDGQLLPPNAPPVKGRQAIGELVSQFIKDPNFSASHDIVDVEVSRGGDLAYIYYTYELTVSNPDGSPVTERGKAIYILQRQPEAEWEFLFDIWNSDSGGER